MLLEERSFELWICTDGKDTQKRDDTSSNDFCGISCFDLNRQATLEPASSRQHFVPFPGPAPDIHELQAKQKKIPQLPQIQ